MLDYTYRFWLAKHLAVVFFPPAALCYVLLRTVAAGKGPWSLSGVSCFVFCFFSTPVFWAFAGRVGDWRDSITAKKYGARVIPVIKGKRFADVDLIAR